MHMMRNILLFVLFAFVSIGDVSAKKGSGILLYNHEGKKFKVYANGSLQNTDFMNDVKVCCFPDEMVNLKIEFEDKSTTEGCVSLRRGYIEHIHVSKYGMEHDHYQRVPEALADETKPTLISMPKEERPVVKRKDCSAPTSNTEFFTFYNHIKEHRGFDSEKLQEAKDAVVSGCFTSKQVKVTMSGFLYETTKLEFAKFAYNYVFDKDNFDIVAKALDSDESRTNLLAYVHNW